VRAPACVEALLVANADPRHIRRRCALRLALNRSNWPNNACGPMTTTSCGCPARRKIGILITTY